MTQNTMTEKLSEKMNVSLDEARTTLEKSGWNMLTATHMLDQEQFRRKQALNAVVSDCEGFAFQVAPDDTPADEIAVDEVTAKAVVADAAEKAERTATGKHPHGRGLRNLGRVVRRLVACGNRNRFEVRRDDEQVLELPVTALVLAMLCAFWVCLPLLVIGLFTGCRYRFGGRELGREGVNGALDRAADAADRMKKRFAEA